MRQKLKVLKILAMIYNSKPKNMHKSYLKLLFISLLVSSLTQLSWAQKNGIRGYGKSELLYIRSMLSGDVYLGAGGGIVVNDNFQFGVYLRALNKPYKYDAFDAGGDTVRPIRNHPFSLNKNAVSSTAGNIETGVRMGFNIMPDRPFQLTLNGLLGLNSVSFNEISSIPDANPNNAPRFRTDVYTMFGLNTALEANLQVKIGSFLKIGICGGYRFSIVNGRTRNGPILKNPTLFSGPYVGTSLTFGSF